MPIGSTQTLVVPIRLISEANVREHWSKKHRRKKKQREVIGYFLNSLEKPKLPCRIVLTRIAPRKLDYDNLVFAQKQVLDVLCDWLIPGLAPGRADGRDEIKGVEYRQERGAPREYALKIEIISLSED